MFEEVSVVSDMYPQQDVTNSMREVLDLKGFLKENN